MNIKLLICTSLMMLILYTICAAASEQSDKNHKNHSQRNIQNNNNNRNKNPAHNIKTRSEISPRGVKNNSNASHRNLRTQTHDNKSNSNQHVARAHVGMENQQNSNANKEVHHNNQEGIKAVENNPEQRSHEEIKKAKEEELKAELEKLEKNIDNLFDKYYEHLARKSTSTQTPSTTAKQNNLQQPIKLAEFQNCQTDVVATGVVPLAPLASGEQIVKPENPGVKCSTGSSANILPANGDSAVVLTPV